MLIAHAHAHICLNVVRGLTTFVLRRKNMVRSITTVNCMIYTAQTCSFWSVVNRSVRCFRGNSLTFRRSAASGPRTDDK